MTNLLEKEFSQIKDFIVNPLNREICAYLQLFVNDKDTLVTSLVQNPFGESKNLSEITKTFGGDVAAKIEKLNQLNLLDESLLKEYDNLKSIIILFLINHKFLFAHRENIPEIKPLLTTGRIEYAIRLLEQLDISEIRSDLEDQFFNFLEPEVYNHYTQLLKFTRENYQHREKEIKSRIESIIKEGEVAADIQSRLKSVFSVHKKVLKKKILYSQVLDTIGLRIIVDNEKECYQVMGLILKNCVIISNKIKDYIAVPKSNGYQSIHLTIIEGQQPVEIQIRTGNMHHYAQYGLAAHNQYKATI